MVSDWYSRRDKHGLYHEEEEQQLRNNRSLAVVIRALTRAHTIVRKCGRAVAHGTFGTAAHTLLTFGSASKRAIAPKRNGRKNTCKIGYCIGDLLYTTSLIMGFF